MVDGDYHRKGIASQLLSALEVHLRTLGIERYKVVAGEKLVGANRFYRNRGFRLATPITIEGATR